MNHVGIGAMGRREGGGREVGEVGGGGEVGTIGGGRRFRVGAGEERGGIIP